MKVAQELLAFCSQCRMDLTAVVVAMQGDRVLKVYCKTCKKERQYRPPKGTVDPSGPVKTSTPRTRAVQIPIEDEWRKAMAASGRTAVPYSTKTSFQVQDKLKHPQFGDGVVTKKVHPNKVEVLFSMDIKTLICAPHA